jgi:hypothetical protein
LSAPSVGDAAQEKPDYLNQVLLARRKKSFTSPAREYDTIPLFTSATYDNVASYTTRYTASENEERHAAGAFAFDADPRSGVGRPQE